MRKTNWNLLFSNDCVVDLLNDFAFQALSVNEVSEALANTEFAGEFRNLVRTQGTDYARRLARKALRYRGIENEYSR